MDLNDLRTAVMLLGFALFMGLLRHTWSRNRRAEHAAAAALPFVDEGAGAADWLSPQDRRERQGERL